MEHILQDLVNRIGTQMPELLTVDEDYGQLEMIDETGRETYPLTCPAVLVDAAETQWSNDGELCQRGTCTVRVRLVIDCYDDTHFRSGTTDRISEREQMRRKLHLLLQGHRIGEDGALVRTQSRFFTANHGIKVYEQTYTVPVTEYIRDRIPGPKPVRMKIAAGYSPAQGNPQPFSPSGASE